MNVQDGPHTSALRKGRVSQPGRIYLITTVTHTRLKIFDDFLAARVVINTLRWLHAHQRAHSCAFVLMPDHLHWLIELNQAATLSGVVHSLKSHSSRAINRLRGRQAQRVWQRGFHDHAVRREEGIRKLARYVMANPLRAGLVAEIGDYPHWDAIWL